MLLARNSRYVIVGAFVALVSASVVAQTKPAAPPVRERNR